MSFVPVSGNVVQPLLLDVLREVIGEDSSDDLIDSLATDIEDCNLVDLGVIHLVVGDRICGTLLEILFDSRWGLDLVGLFVIPDRLSTSEDSDSVKLAFVSVLD